MQLNRPKLEIVKQFGGGPTIFTIVPTYQSHAAVTVVKSANGLPKCLRHTFFY